jgi:hypothetical protein
MPKITGFHHTATPSAGFDASVAPVQVKSAFFKGPDGEIIELFGNAVL